MRARFVLGPAGTGKTFLCLKEIRAALLENPEGPPLILLAPKQATFQLERQLLEDPTLRGYTRLRIFSFERLARFILDKLGKPLPPLLSAEGRTMVLHGILVRRKEELRIFRASAGLAGFASRTSRELQELQRHRLSPAHLRELARRTEMAPSLRQKLEDLALLLADYLQWLEKNGLQDADCLLDLAAEASRGAASKFELASALWLDGFGEMTPQELNLLAAIAPYCGELTLAFCVDQDRIHTETPWLSIWSGIERTFRNCRERISALPDVELTTEILPRVAATSRYAESAAIRHLEENWMTGKAFDGGDVAKSLRVAACANPAEEAVLAAREILAFARGGGRFREAAVLVRRMEGYHDELRRVFTRYQIPFFLDRRESIAHHPLAELTRSSLRAAGNGWQQEDWFGALKSGLVLRQDWAVDRLENEALARGLKGEAWFEPFRLEGEELHWVERLRRACIQPFAKLRRALGPAGQPLSGAQLARALRELWRALRVEKKLESWNDPVHGTVWDQMNTWLDDLEMAFKAESFPLSEWLPLLEAGLSGLSVGVIPPALDQVLIGAIDRSRHPELKLALALGFNEKVFPAAPAADGLLTESDREELRQCGARIGQDTREFLSREQFFGYIACTRSSRRLVVTCSRADANDEQMNPSLFISKLQALFPKLEIENYARPDWTQAEHPCELIGRLAGAAEIPRRLDWPVFDSLRAQLNSFRAPAQPRSLSPELARQLYGPALSTSVSRLEQFAACSFRFFVHSGLRAEERKFFELDARERGTFQHEALRRFHEELRAENKRWRDITPAEGRRRIGRIVTDLALTYRDGLMQSNAQTRFSARVLARSLQDFVGAMVEWMSQYEFDPREAEMGFGTGDRRLPAWELDLGGGRRLLFRGVIDRIDLSRADGKDEALAVVVDYKSGLRKLEKIMMAHGLQLQLAAYLSVLRHLRDAKVFGVARLVPAGVFYVNLGGQTSGGATRDAVLRGEDGETHPRYQHAGRFDAAALRFLDNRGEPVGTQFKYRLNKDGQASARGSDLMSAAQFEQLLDQVEEQLIRMGREIYNGVIEPNPYQHGKRRACDKCDYPGICRFDPWTQPFRVLREEK